MFWVPIWLPEMQNPRLTRVLSLKSTPGWTQQVKSDRKRQEFYQLSLKSLMLHYSQMIR